MGSCCSCLSPGGGKKVELDESGDFSNIRPRPPTQRKAHYFKASDFKEIDKYCKKVPLRYVQKNFKKLIKRLTRKGKSELEVVRALFVWLTHVDLEDVAADSVEAQPGSPLEYLRKIKWRLANHAQLFAALCESAGIRCEVIDGMTKNASYRAGCALSSCPELKAQWNAVLIDGEWRLLDTLWASCCLNGSQHPDWLLVNVEQLDKTSGKIKNKTNNDDDDDDDDDDDKTKIHRIVNEFFFLTDPDMLVGTHFPQESCWQLLPSSVSLDKFERYVYIRERFFQVGLKPSSQSKKYCVLRTTGGEVSVSFTASVATRTAVFKYLCYSLQTQYRPEYSLAHYVMYEQSSHQLAYTLRFPQTGTFRIDVFGYDPDVHAAFDLVFSYVIECKEAQANCQPLPDCPAIGWGQSVKSTQLGVIDCSHTHSTILTSAGRCELRLTVNSDVTITASLRHLDMEAWLLRTNLLVSKEGNVFIIQLRLPEAGEYALKLFAANQQQNMFQNVCNYLVKCTDTPPDGSGFPIFRGVALGQSDLCEYFRVRPINPRQPHVQAAGKSLVLELEKRHDVELLLEINHNDVDSTHLNAETKQRPSVQPERAIFDVSFPRSGEYAINVFAYESSSKWNVHHVFTYFVYCEEAGGRWDDVEPPGSITPLFITTAKDEITLRMTNRTSALVAQVARYDVIATGPVSQVTTKVTKTNTIFKVGLAECGDYEILIYEEDKPGLINAIAWYDVCRQSDVVEEVGEISEEMSAEQRAKLDRARFKENQVQVLRRQLRVAIRGRKHKLLQETLAQLETLDIADLHSDLQEAREMLKTLEFDQTLSNVMSSKDISALEDLISKLEKIPWKTKKIHMHIAAAKNRVEELKRIERLNRLKRLRRQQQEIYNLDGMTIAEIKSYSHPPIPVKLVMMATCVLLGETDETIKDWKTVQAVINRTGKQSLQRRVFELDTEGLMIQVALRARTILGNLDVTEVSQVSPGTASFFSWCRGMIEEAESRFLLSGGNMDEIWKASSSGTRSLVMQMFHTYYNTTKTTRSLSMDVSSQVKAATMMKKAGNKMAADRRPSLNKRQSTRSLQSKERTIQVDERWEKLSGVSESPPPKTSRESSTT